MPMESPRSFSTDLQGAAITVIPNAPNYLQNIHSFLINLYEPDKVARMFWDFGGFIWDNCDNLSHRNKGV